MTIADEILSLWEKRINPTDVCLWEIQKKYNNDCFVLYPNLAICDLCSSNTTNKRSQEKLSKLFRWNLNEYNARNYYKFDNPKNELTLYVNHFEENYEIYLNDNKCSDFNIIENKIFIETNEPIKTMETYNLFLDNIE